MGPRRNIGSRRYHYGYESIEHQKLSAEIDELRRPWLHWWKKSNYLAVIFQAIVAVLSIVITGFSIVYAVETDFFKVDRNRINEEIAGLETKLENIQSENEGYLSEQTRIKDSVSNTIADYVFKLENYQREESRLNLWIEKLQAENNDTKINVKNPRDEDTDNFEDYVTGPYIDNTFTEVIQGLKKAGIHVPINTEMVSIREGSIRQDLKIVYQDRPTQASPIFEMGKYQSTASATALIALRNTLEAFVKENYQVDNKKISITIIGFADAMHIAHRGIAYNGEYGEAVEETYYSKNDSTLKSMHLLVSDHLSNESLAFLRAYEAKDILSNSEIIDKTNIKISTELSSKKGGEYRGIQIEIFIKDAYKTQFEKLNEVTKEKVREHYKKKLG